VIDAFSARKYGATSIGASEGFHTGLKLLALLNGAGAVALLAYAGHASGKASVPDVRLPMACYLIGLLLCGLAFLASYLTQFCLYNEVVGNVAPGRHGIALCWAVVLAVGSLTALTLGSYWTVSVFQSTVPTSLWSD
jgi:hypothetical protein